MIAIFLEEIRRQFARLLLVVLIDFSSSLRCRLKIENRFLIHKMYRLGSLRVFFGVLFRCLLFFDRKP